MLKGKTVLLGVTGGYLTGFLLTGILYWLITAMAGNGAKARLLAMATGLFACYLTALQPDAAPELYSEAIQH